MVNNIKLKGMPSVMIINDSLIKGGRERRLLELVKGLLKDGRFKVTLVILHDIVEYDYVRQLPVDLVVVERRHKTDLSAFSRLRKLVKEKNPDIIHSWSSMASVFLIPALLRYRKKFINGIIADAPGSVGWTNKYFLRSKITYPFSDVVVSNSKAGIKSYDAPEKKSVCIYNGIDFKRFDNLRNPGELKKEVLGFCDKPVFIAGMVAAFEERKDYHTLVEAAVELCSLNKDLYFLLIGKGNMVEEIKRKIPSGLLDAQIRFLGARSDVESLIQLFDVGILMTNANIHGEGVSNSIIEYMTGGKPVIASKGGGTDEVIDGKNGFLIDAFDKQALKEKILHLIKHPDDKKEMGAYARSYAYRHFNLETMTREYIDLYDRLLKK